MALGRWALGVGLVAATMAPSCAPSDDDRPKTLGDAPDTTIGEAPTGHTTRRGAILTFACDRPPCTFACRLAPAGEEPCSSPASFTNLADGAYVFEVRASDAAGRIDPTPAQATWTVDTVAPVTTVSGGPTGVVTTTEASFELACAAPPCGLSCSVDGAGFEPCTSPKTLTGLIDGPHSFAARSSDLAGNVEAVPVVRTWIVDTSPPETELTTVPVALTNEAGPTLVFACDESSCTFECSLDGGPWGACASPLTLPILIDGAHSFAVRARDVQGTVDATPATTSWTLDTSIPDTAIDAAPSGNVVSDGTATFSFSCTEAACVFECALDGGAFVSCAAIDYTLTGLAAGAHELAVRARDAAGNVDPSVATRAWTLDRYPDTALGETPPTNAASTTARFVFTCDEAVCTFECRIDGAAYAPCAADLVLPGLAVGVHTLTVRAVDSLGNRDQTPSSHTWVVAPFSVIAAGDHHACAIRATDGKPMCWGKNDGGQLGFGFTVGARLPGAVAGDLVLSKIATGAQDSCGITTGGALWCWGAQHASTSPTRIGTDADWSSVAVGAAHACGMRGGNTVYCWGSNTSGQLAQSGSASPTPLQVAAGTAWAAVDVGGDTSCALTDVGALWCWGAGYGATPTQVGAAATWAKVSVGTDHRCAVQTNGSAWCWGANDVGQFGRGDLVSSATPVAVNADTDWDLVEAGPRATCARKTGGTVSCWGTMQHGRFDTTSSSPDYTPSPFEVGSGLAAQGLVVGLGFACALDAAATTRCWGDNLEGQLGLGGAGRRLSPTRVALAAGVDALTVSVGSAHACALMDTGAVACWGEGGMGQLGTSKLYDASAPVEASGPGDWLTMLASGQRTCATRGTGELSCAGVGTSYTLAATASSVSDWVEVSFAPEGLSACGIRGDDSLWCWGWNTLGQVGDGSTTDRPDPVPIATGTSWLRVAAAEQRTCAIALDGGLWCWGSNASGWLGVGDTLDHHVPTPVMPARAFVAVALGQHHGCAVAADSTLWCWGSNSSSQAAGPLGVAYDTPRQVGSGLQWTGVAAAGDSSCAWKADGSAYCWGKNDQGQLGTGTQANSGVPLLVVGNGAWERIAMGVGATCGLRVDGSVWCWGDHRQGRIGDGMAWRSEPAVVP